MAKIEGITKRTIKRADGTTYDRWRARYSDGSDQIEQTFSTLADAKKWRRTQLSAIDTGQHIDPRDKRTLANVADEWRETWTDLEPKTTQGYASILAYHVIPAFGSIKVSAITPGAVQAWVNDLSQTRAPNTVSHIHNVLRAVLDLAQTRKYISTNPATSVKLPRKPATNDSQLYLTAPELRQLVAAMPSHWRLPTLVSGRTGVRAGELWAITRENVDLLHGKLTIAHAIKDIRGKLQVGPTKGHARRTLTIPPSLIPELTQSLTNGVRGRKGYAAIIDGELAHTQSPNDSHRLLFTTPRGTPVTHTNFYERVYQPAVKSIWPEPHRLAGCRYHDLRHTAAALSLAADASERGLFIVMKRLGHKDIRTTINVYGHLAPDVDVAHADDLDAAWLAPAPISNVISLGQS